MNAPVGLPLPHSVLEDLLALLIGSLLIGLGLLMLQAAHLFTGGIAGIALILHYLTGAPVGPLFVAANVPFMLFAWHMMGAAFTLRTLAVNLLLAAISLGLPHVIRMEIQPLFAALAGGVLVGLGILTLVRHRASVGGIGVVAIWAQDRHGINAGRVQMAADAAILLCALAGAADRPVAAIGGERVPVRLDPAAQPPARTLCRVLTRALWTDHRSKQG